MLEEEGLLKLVANADLSLAVFINDATPYGASYPEESWVRVENGFDKVLGNAREKVRKEVARLESLTVDAVMENVVFVVARPLFFTGMMIALQRGFLDGELEETLAVRVRRAGIKSVYEGFLKAGRQEPDHTLPF